MTEARQEYASSEGHLQTSLKQVDQTPYRSNVLTYKEHRMIKKSITSGIHISLYKKYFLFLNNNNEL